MLCIPNEQRDAMHTEACGTIFKEAVNQALAAGAGGGGCGSALRGALR